jgi:hypothetical protein
MERGWDRNQHYGIHLYHAARYEHAIRLRAEGLTFKAIAVHLGCCMSRVGQIIQKCARHGITI